MSIGIDIQIGNPGEKEPLRSEIKKVFEGREGNWYVSIIDDQKNTKREVKVKEIKEGGGFKWKKDFQATGDHSPNFIAGEIKKALSS